MAGGLRSAVRCSAVPQKRDASAGVRLVSPGLDAELAGAETGPWIRA